MNLWDTTLALDGTPILTIKELLGHQTLAMTERYSHLSPDHKKVAIQGIESAIKKGRLEMAGSGKALSQDVSA